MDVLFHGCAYVNSDGTQKLIALSEDCLVCTNKCFWKDPHDVITHTKTRSMTKNEGKTSLKTTNDYFKDKEKRQGHDLKFVYFILR